jgi:glutamate/tyrosine decarboxylase-like PLP-dependent enzyme
LNSGVTLESQSFLTPPAAAPTLRTMSEATSHSDLILDAGRMRALGYHVIDRLVERWTGLRDLPVWREGVRTELEALLREPPPEQATPFEQLTDLLFDEVLARGARVDHPRFMAFVPSAPVWPAVLGDLVATGCDVFQGTWLASAGASTVELVVLDWFRTWLEMPASAGGLLVSGGSVANLTAIATARHARFGGHDGRAVIYLSRETHSSVPRAARTLGFAPDRLRYVDGDALDRIDPDALRGAIDADAAAGRVPFLVVANAGTTSTGAIDPLPALADVCAEHDLWLHADAAYGGFAALTTRGRELLRGIERADSVTLDPHKWLYQPFEAGCVLLREPGLLREAFHVLPAYMQDTAVAPAPPELDPAAPVNFAERGVQLTRAARALKIWLSLKTFGVQPFRAAIDHCMALALLAEAHVRGSATLELLRPASLGIVCFRRAGGDDPDAVDAHNARLTGELAASGRALISSTRVDGRYALRLCVLNYRTTREDVLEVLRFLES